MPDAGAFFLALVGFWLRVLLIFQQDTWLPFGLISGGAYVYFSGRGIATRITMLNRGIKTGTSQSTRVALVFLGMWGAFGFGTIVLVLIRCAGCGT